MKKYFVYILALIGLLTSNVYFVTRYKIVKQENIGEEVLLH